VITSYELQLTCLWKSLESVELDRRLLKLSKQEE